MVVAVGTMEMVSGRVQVGVVIKAVVLAGVEALLVMDQVQVIFISIVVLNIMLIKYFFVI